MTIHETYRGMDITLDTEANTLSLNGLGYNNVTGPAKPGMTIEQVRAILDRQLDKLAQKPTTATCMVAR